MATTRGDTGSSLRLTTLGVGAQSSPRYRPAGLLVACGAVRIMIDGGPGAVPDGRLDAWLVTDERAELIAEIRRAAGAKGLRPRAGTFRKDGVRVERRRVAHTSHPTWGYRIRARGRTIVWAPEFYGSRPGRAVPTSCSPRVRPGTVRSGSREESAATWTLPPSRARLGGGE